MLDETKRAIMSEVKAEDITDLAPTTKQAIEILGLDKFIDLCYILGGLTFYVPKFDRVAGAARDRLIAREFNGGNYAELAKKYELTEVWVRQIVNRDRVIKGQMSLFDESVFQTASNNGLNKRIS